MASGKMSIVILLISGFVCFQNAVGINIYEWPDTRTEFVRDTNADPIGTGYGNFRISDIISDQLMSNRSFRDLFFKTIDVDVAFNIGISIAKALVNKYDGVDLFTITNLLTNALISIYPQSGPEYFAKALSECAEKMLNDNIVNVTNPYEFADIFKTIIINYALYGTAGSDYASDINRNLGETYSGGLGLIPETGLNARNDLNFAAGSNFETDFNSNIGTGLDIEAGLNFDGGLNFESGFNSYVGTGLDIETGLGLEAGLNIEAGSDLGAGLDFEAGFNPYAGVGSDIAAGLGLNEGLDFKEDSNFKAGFNPYAGVGLDIATGLGLNEGLDFEEDLNFNAGFNPYAGAGLDVEASFDLEGSLDFEDLNYKADFNPYAGVGLDIAAGLGLNEGLDFEDDLNFNAGFNPYAGAGLDIEASFDLEGSLDFEDDLNFKAGFDPYAGAGLDMETSLNFESSLDFEDDLDFKAGFNSYVGAGLDIDASLGLEGDLDLEASLEFEDDLDFNAGFNSYVGAGLDIEAGLNLEDDLDFEDYFNFDPDFDVEGESGFNVETHVYTDTGFEASLDFDVDLEDSLNIGTGFDLNANLESDDGAKLGAGANIEVNAGLNIDFEISADVITLFRTVLVKEILKDKYFRNAFSDNISIYTSAGVSAAISECLSKAFGVPRAYFLLLEQNLVDLSRYKSPNLILYADVIATTIAKILLDVKLIANATAALQITMASKAISSGISNFLQISSVPTVWDSISSNLFNSFFSLLSGLEKLPYVGIDAVSPNIPTGLRTAKASKSELQFTKLLYYNLIDSRRFYESFSLGVPTSALKLISNSLGDSVAEAVGSTSSSFFADVYTKALLTTGNRLNYETYARSLSVATAKAFYSLGYFLSGNVNIQATIATNAIITGLQTKCRLRIFCPQVTLFPEVINIPLTTTFSGVAPPDSFLKLQAGIGLNADASIYLNLDSALNANSAVSENLGLDLDLDVSSEASVSANVAGSVDVNADASLGLGVDDIGLGVGAATNAKLSILNILPHILANKFYRSIALQTSISLVGSRTVINLIAQSMAVQFGFPVASVFLTSYDKNLVDKDSCYETSIIALAAATSDAFASVGILNSKFTLLTAEQLATASVYKFSSLIVTSLECGEC